jgi:hypothetical protein
VLLIDDAPKSVSLPKDVEVIPLDPEDENFGTDLEASLERGDLILLDQNLHREQVLGLGALDGASFVGNLRSWARSKELVVPPIAIYTSEDDAFRDEVPAVGPAVPLNGSFIGREARIAPSLDVEWLIPKDEDFSIRHVESLAYDCLALRCDAGNARMSLQEIAKFLAIPTDAPWSQIAMEQLARWRPPINEAGDVPASSRGATPVLRWLLHRVLPCPGLLLSDLYAAWSIGIEPEDLSNLCNESNEREWARDLRGARYGGAGKDLFTPRWWAAGIDFMSWRLREHAEAVGDFQQALTDIAGPGVRALASQETVVVVNSDLEELALAPLGDAVQVHPPGWPSEAADPWMLREEVEADPVAKTMVDPTQQPGLA